VTGLVEPVVRTSNVLVLPDAHRVAVSVAERLMACVQELLAEQAVARVALTGGRTGVAVLERIRDDPRHELVDWSRVEVYWSDERFVARDDAERNERQAREALLDHVNVDPARIHPMPSLRGPHGDDVEAAAADYAIRLEEGVPPQALLLDVCLLGVGEEGHVASVFPDSAAVRETGRSVVAVHGCPKPPATRISLTLPAIRRAGQVWLMTAGTGKADAVSAALRGAQPSALPAAGARGRSRTLWFLDPAAASGLTGG
jgi:6-phosphogluconolactonase